MATWCTEGVKRQFEEGYRRNAYNAACKREEKADKEIKKLRAKIIELEETYIERDDDSL